MTPEERAELREEVQSAGDNDFFTGATITKLLDALDASEAERDEERRMRLEVATSAVVTQDALDKALAERDAAIRKVDSTAALLAKAEGALRAAPTNYDVYDANRSEVYATTYAITPAFLEWLEGPRAEALSAIATATADEPSGVERRTFWKHESSDDYDEIARYSSEQACVDDCTEGDAVVRVDEARTVVYREPSLRAGWGKEVYTRAKGIVAAKKAADPPAPAKADEQTHPPSCSSYEGPYCDCGLAEYLRGSHAK